MSYGLISLLLLMGWIFLQGWLPGESPVTPDAKVRLRAGNTPQDPRFENPFSVSGPQPPAVPNNASPDDLDAIVQKIRRNKGSLDESMKESLNRLAQSDPMRMLEALAPILQAFPENWDGWIC